MMGVLLSCTHLFAQNRTITGTVTDANGVPIPGATVSAVGASTTAVANANGVFTISVPTSVRALTITSIGYDPFTVNLTASNAVSASLAVATRQMETVVVTGYGNVERSKYAGAASKVGEKEIRNVPIGSFDQILQGRAPGVTVLSGNGQPGSSANVIIRGQTSIAGGNSPLYIVDGIPVESGVFQSINPNDIASVDILKDATASALYGSRGAAGVIVVTTKRGKSGKMKPVPSFFFFLSV